MGWEQLNKWLTCTECDLHKYRRKVVLGRGDIPAEFFFIGEAPGKSEDLLGEAFVGPSGKILTIGIEDAVERAGLEELPSFCISNTLACRPTDKQFGANREPTALEQMACWPRLKRTELLVQPRAIILLGKIAKRFLIRRFPSAYCLQHPAYLLRRGGTASTEYRTFVRELADIFKVKPERKLFVRTAKRRKLR